MPSSPKRVALVTGVTRRQGIGAAIALTLAKNGVSLGIAHFRPYERTKTWDTHDDEPEKIISDLRKAGVEADGFEIDLGGTDGPKTLFEQVLKRFDHVDILVNNAAYATDTAVSSLRAEELDRHYEVNLRAPMLLSVEFVRAFQAGADGRIINLTSGQGLGPMPNELAYAATKGGIEAFTLSLSAAVAPLGITVNAVDPGATDTGWMSKQLRQRLLDSAPMGRLGLPADAANLISFLASAEAGWITGQIIRSRGGL